MSDRKNEFDQPIGTAMPGWSAVTVPPDTPMEGTWCRVERLDIEKHFDDLFDALVERSDDSIWTYLAVGPYDNPDDLRVWLGDMQTSPDPLFHAIIDLRTGKAVGFATFMRIEPAHGVIEVGNINFSQVMQKTPVATEAMFLMAKRVFDELGYRRYEWKCDSLNAPSRRAAERFGFTYDGLFPKALIYKNRSRDTAWFSMVDDDWPAIRRGFEAWLDAGNFDKNGQQKARLGDLIKHEKNAG